MATGGAGSGCGLLDEASMNRKWLFQVWLGWWKDDCGPWIDWNWDHGGASYHEVPPIGLMLFVRFSLRRFNLYEDEY